MKKTLTVNLGGRVYHIDEDAYNLLDNYLDNLRLHFSKEEGGEEIVNDIEIRISELFSQKISSSIQVITIADVEEIVRIMGTPADFMGEDNEEFNEEPKSRKEKGQTLFKKRLYRNPDDKLLGGVLSGIAAYFQLDPTIVRVVFVFLLFAGLGTFIPVYIVLWLLVPEAKSAVEKLNMRGEDVNLENIGKTVTETFEKVYHSTSEYIATGKPKSFFKKCIDLFLSLLAIIFKLFLIFLLVLLTPFLLIIAFVFFVVVLAFISSFFTGGVVLFTGLTYPLSGLMEVLPFSVSLSGMLIVLLPLLIVIYSLFRRVMKWKSMSTAIKWILFIIWFLSLVVFVTVMNQQGWMPFYDAINYLNSL